MLVDDTRDRIYIHNLDAEVKQAEEEEGKLVFLPDIEKKLGKIPQSVLNDVHPSAYGKQMVLYSVPESLSVPKEKDSVRKAIIESRERAREEQAKKMKTTNGLQAKHEGEDEPLHFNNGNVPESTPTVITTDVDPEPMDIG